jgi:hypothetical protein
VPLCYFVIIKYSNFITYIHSIHTLIFCSFVALFKDEYKLPKGSVIELSRESNHVLKISSKFILFLISPSLLLISVLRWSIYFGCQGRCLYVAMNIHIHVSLNRVSGNILILFSQSDRVAHMLNQIDKHSLQGDIVDSSYPFPQFRRSVLIFLNVQRLL